MEHSSRTGSTRTRRARRHPFVLAIVVVIAVLAAACGGDDADEVSSDAPVATEDQPTPEVLAETTPAADAGELTEETAATEPAAQDAAAADGAGAGGEVTPQGLCDALESSGMVEALDLQITAYSVNDGDIGLPGCSPNFVGGGTVLSLAIEDPGNYSGATGAELLEAIRRLSDSFLGEGEDRPDLGEGAIVYDSDADSDPGATILIRLGDQVISMILDGDDPIDEVVAGMEQVVAALGG